MLRALFGPSTVPTTLRSGLDQSMATHRQIAQRVAESMSTSAEASADIATNAAAAASRQENLANDMASLADTQIRFEAEARLLNLVYQGLRTSIHRSG